MDPLLSVPRSPQYPLRRDPDTFLKEKKTRGAGTTAPRADGGLG